MLTEDIDLDIAEGWRSLTCTGTVVHIVSIVNSEIFVRLGINSTSQGIRLKQGDIFSANETIFVQPVRLGSNGKGSLIIMRD